MLNILIPTTKVRRERLEHCVRTIKENVSIPYILSVYENSLGGWVAPTHAMVSNVADGSLVVVVNDDMEIQKGCIELMVDIHSKVGGLCYPNDGINDGRIATMPMATKEWFLAHFYTGYIHNFADTEMTDKARANGELHYVNDAKINHKHWTTGAFKDETYQLQSNTWRHDEALYNSRR